MQKLAKLAREANKAIHEHQDYEKACRLFTQYYEGLDTIHPLPSFDKAQVALSIAICMSKTGRHEEAIECAQDQVGCFGPKPRKVR